MDATYKDFLTVDSPGVLRFGGARMALFDIEAGFWGLRRQMEALVGQHLTDQTLQQAGANGGASFAASFIGEVSEAEGEQALLDVIAAYQAAGFGHFEVEAFEWPIGRITIRGRNLFEAWAARKHAQVSKRSVCAYSAGVLVGFVNVLSGRRDVVCIERTCQAQGAEACVFELLPADVAGDTPIVSMAPDPSLGHQLNLLELLFDRMPMGIAILDRHFYLRRYNPTWADYTELYKPPSASQVAPGLSYFDLLPGSEPLVIPLFERVLAGETIRQEATRLESEGIVTYWDMVLTPLFGDGEVTGILNVTVDATERKRAEERLLEEEAQFRGIFESTFNALLIFDLNGTVVEANPAACEMYGYSYEELVGLSGRDIVHPDYYYLFEDFKRKVQAHGHFSTQTVDQRKDGSPIDIEVHGTSFRYAGEPHLLAVAQDITERVLARQILERRVEERTRELQTLLDVTAAASSSLELDEMLSAALDRLVALVGASRAGVMLLDDSSGKLQLRMMRPEYPIAPDDLVEVIQACREVVASGEPLYLPVDAALGHIEPGALLPLRVRGQALGVLGIVGPKDSAFSEEHLALFESIADQLGVAIENTRLFEQAEHTAVAAERSRLARDLHDAVTQTLFAASLTAEALPHIWERHPDEGRQRLEKLRKLTQGALAEMRTLLLELRPATLINADIEDLLNQLAESTTGRAGVPVNVDMDGECILLPEIKVALYRIAQEALNNIAKHAQAEKVTVRLFCQAEGVELVIQDDGCGFDPSSVSPQKMGLGIMRERAEAIGATIEIESQAGQGTQIRTVYHTGKGKDRS